MNCQLLQQAITQNQQLAESIQQQLDQINETGQASKKPTPTARKLSS